MFDWRNLTKNPNDLKIIEKMRKNILMKRKFVKKKRIEFLIDKIEGKKFLDIGICDHYIERMNSNDWRHKKLIQKASYALGLDILSDLIDVLKNKGYNVVCMDAISDKNLGEKFDIIYLGDIIEHVSNPVKLIEFSKRHLNKNGSIFINTPNPFYYGRLIRMIKKKIFIDNLEHISWITFSNIVEISCRVKMKFQNYYMFEEKYHIFFIRFIIRVLKRIFGDLLIPNYFYELKNWGDE